MARRSPALLGLLVFSVTGCTGPPAEVVIETRVGEERARTDLEAARETTAALLEVGEQWWAQRDQRRAVGQIVDSSAGADTKASSAPEPIAYDPLPPRDPSGFAAQVHALREGPLDEAVLLTRNLAEAGPKLWPEIAPLLLAERDRPKREYKQVLALIGGDVPNRYGHFALHWKKAHGYDVRVSEDWFEDLLGVATARISTPLHPVYRDALLTVALLRAASKAAREDPKLVADVVSTLLDSGYVLDGTFRDEVGRAIDAIGDPAIPPLLRESVAPEGADEASTAARRAAYATYCLDRMDRLHPSRAIEAVSHERRLLADVLQAYAIVRDGEAAPLLLDHVDADAPGVRRAARDAFESYVTGPLPSVRRKSIRLLGGRTSTQRAELSYREHARLAIRQRLETAAPELLEPECELRLGGGLVDAKCEGQPERLFGAYIDLLDRRRLARRDATVAQALSSDDPIAGAAMLDTLLSDGSEPVDPDLIAPFYSEVAIEIEASGDPARAAQLLRKSAMLLADVDADRARELSVDALVLEAQVDGVDERGRMMLLGTARDLAPDEPTVTAALGQLEAQIDESTATTRGRLRLYLLALLACLGVLAWIGTRIHRPHEPAREC
ncbi:hypothetical protein [Enhygromyxa salina]|uniref:Uncharacterized protein n=1 Tax=Enhygromyxa salina TaxID=215803 RepID=A0A2S9YMR4_9BACT|nr:hypothetical protein [Enhygromyxa salina]PRQ06372.1 hypothetical protein ENSA7_39180 [Enhygromyxa salina]